MEQRRDGGGPTLLGGVKDVGGVATPRQPFLPPLENPQGPAVPFDPIFADRLTLPLFSQAAVSMCHLLAVSSILT